MTDFETVYERLCLNVVTDPPWGEFSRLPVVVSRRDHGLWECQVVISRYPNICQGTMVSAHHHAFPEPITGDWYVLRGPGQLRPQVVEGIGVTLIEAMLALEKNLADRAGEGAS